MQESTLFTEDHHALTSRLPEGVPAWLANILAFTGTRSGSGAKRVLRGSSGKMSPERCQVTVAPTSLPCCAADLGRCIQVLLDPHSVQGHLEPSRPTGSSVAALSATGIGVSGPDDNQGQAGHLIPAEIGALLGVSPGGGWRFGADEAAAGQLIPTLTTRCGNGLDDQQTNQLVPIGFDKYNQSVTGDTAHTIRAGAGTEGIPAISFHMLQDPIVGDDLAPSLGETGDAGGSSRANGVLTPTLAVRRLTPIECERLMAWPDDHTRWGDYGNGVSIEIADSHRYAMCGNGVVSYQAGWIGRRLVRAAA